MAGPVRKNKTNKKHTIIYRGVGGGEGERERERQRQRDRGRIRVLRARVRACVRACVCACVCWEGRGGHVAIMTLYCKSLLSYPSVRGHSPCSNFRSSVPPSLPVPGWPGQMPCERLSQEDKEIAARRCLPDLYMAPSAWRVFANTWLAHSTA